ncbi:hypothetical protein [Microseira sp. BLCC-F43]|uniref:hypothetical protein n=1 Tax=Microseira sp. BLCC-F43 TaxID=3153602 RepID=UPI0035B7C731
MSSEVELLVEKKQLELWESNELRLIPPKFLKYYEELLFYQQRNNVNDDKAVGHVGELSGVVVPPVGSELQRAGFFNWGDVASTIYNFILRTTGFNPANVDAQTNEFRDFLNMFASCPYWNGLDFGIQYRDVNIYAQDYRDAVNAVQDMLGGFMTQTARDQLINSIRQVSENAARSGGREQKNSLFNNGVISGNNKGLYVFVIYSFVRMVQVQQGKHNVLQQELRVVAAHGLLNTDFCNRNAANIIRYDRSNIDEWERGGGANNFPPNNSPGWPA